MTSRRQVLRYVSLGLLGALGLAGCGFKLREQVALRFDSIWINLPKQSEFGGELRRAIVHWVAPVLKSIRRKLNGVFMSMKNCEREKLLVSL